MVPAKRPLSRVIRAFDRIPWWAIDLGFVVDVVAVLGVAFGRIAVQSAIQGLVVGSIYVLGASGLSLTYGIKKFANFAHGDLMTFGAYVAFSVNVLAGANILLGFVAAIFAVAFLAMLLELAVFRRLSARGPVPALIASVGVALVLQNVIGAIFLGDPRYLNVTIPQDFPIGVTGLSFNWVKGGATLAISLLLVVALHVLLKFTILGKAMRACADDIDLARTSGINTRNVILWTWAISGGLAAVAGVLLAIIVNVNPLLGFFVLLFIFAAVIVGGIDSPQGALIGGLVIGLVQKLSSVIFTAMQERGWIAGSGSAYEPAGAFLVMVVLLLFKPEGIMGSTRARLGGRITAQRIRRAFGGLRRG